MSRLSRILVVLNLCALSLTIALMWDKIALLTSWGLPTRVGAPMLIVAHRGNIEAYPEDTAEAIWDAARLGADGIEFDVHQSADGTWWVMHDATVDRTTNGTGSVANLTDQELAALRIDGGLGFDPDATVVIQPPRLSTVLDGLEGYRGELYLDLQHAIDADPEDLARQLAGRRFGERVTVICRDEADIQALHAVSRSVEAIIRMDRVGSTTAADGYLLESVNEVSADSVRELHRPVATYTDELFAYLGEEAVLRRAWAVGVDAFLSKRLAAAMTLRDQLALDRMPGVTSP